MNTQLSSILFSDLKGFSLIENDQLLEKVKNINDKIKLKIIDDYESVHHWKTWGDAFVICSTNPYDLVKIALSMRDFVMHYEWKRNFFPQEFEIRIGLHLDTISIYDDGEVSGMGMTKAARIEPITRPNSVFCSEAFWGVIKNEQHSKIRGCSLGSQKLAKNFGEMQLFEISRTTDSIQTEDKEDNSEKVSSSGFVPRGITIPNIKKRYSDKEKLDYCREGFLFLKDYFQYGLETLKDHDSRVSFELQEISKDEFHVKIFVDGNLSKEGKFWVQSGQYGSFDCAINYSCSIASDNSYNEMISVNQNEYTLHFSPLYMCNIYSGKSFSKEITNNQDLGQYLWECFIEGM